MFSDNRSMDKMLYLHMITNNQQVTESNESLYNQTYKHLLEPKRVGTFIQNSLADAIQSGQDDNFEIMVSNLKKLMTNLDSSMHN